MGLTEEQRRLLDGFIHYKDEQEKQLRKLKRRKRFIQKIQKFIKLFIK